MKNGKIVSLCIATLLATGMILGGCGKNAEGKTDSGKGEKAADKIVIFQSKVEISDQVEAMAEEYEEETGVEVEVWGTTGEDYFQQLKTKLANGQGPTIFTLLPGAETQQMDAYLEDLSDLEFVDKMAEGMVPVQDNKIVGIPYTVEGFGMVYNKALVNPDEVTDYDSFVTMLKEQKANGVNGFELSQESYFLIGHILNTPFALQENPQEFVQEVIDGKVQLKTIPEFQEFAKFLKAIKEYSSNPLEITYDKACGDLATGKAAAIHQGNWSAGMFADYDDFEMGMMPLPICGNDKLSVSASTAWCVNSEASDTEKKAAKQFLNWLYTSETGIHYLMDEFGFIPLVEGMENENMDMLSKEVEKYTKEGKTISWPMNDWPAGIVDVYLVPVAESFFTTDMTEEELLDSINEAFVSASNNK